MPHVRLATRLKVWLLIIWFTLTPVAVIFGIWRHSRQHVPDFAAGVAVVLFVALGTLMAHAWGRRFFRCISIYAILSVAASIAIANWLPHWPWSLVVVRALQLLLYVGMVAILLIATEGWIRFARHGSACLDYLDTSPTAKAPEQSS